MNEKEKKFKSGHSSPAFTAFAALFSGQDHLTLPNCSDYSIAAPVVVSSPNIAERARGVGKKRRAGSGLPLLLAERRTPPLSRKRRCEYGGVGLPGPLGCLSRRGPYRAPCVGLSSAPRYALSSPPQYLPSYLVSVASFGPLQV